MARRIGTDPATLSSPLITSIMDLLGVFIYFGFAWLLLGERPTGFNFAGIVLVLAGLSAAILATRRKAD